MPNRLTQEQLCVGDVVYAVYAGNGEVTIRRLTIRDVAAAWSAPCDYYATADDAVRAGCLYLEHWRTT